MLLEWLEHVWRDDGSILKNVLTEKVNKKCLLRRSTKDKLERHCRKGYEIYEI